MEEYLKDIKAVYCQGKLGAYSHIASKIIFPDIEPFFVRNFEDVCLNVLNGDKVAGILPSENSSAGLVNGIIHLLLKYRLNIVYAKTVSISHLLCAKKGTRLENISKIFSHQQALLQCSSYLNTLKAEQIETTNTAASALMASGQENAAAVCSKEAAEIYGLEIIKEDICNNKNNSTRFIVIAKENQINENANVTSLYFKLKNISGSLYKALKIFADYSINLSSIHSLPLEEEPWNYGFYADTEGKVNSNRMIEGLKALEAETEYLKILGSFKSE